MARMASARIVVIGAGVAGLAAARALVRRGHEVIVLEARPRIGGRILTRHARDVAAPIELGAEMIHGDAPETLRIVGAAGLRTAPLDGATRVARGGRLRQENLPRSLERVFRLIDPGQPDESFASFLTRRPGGRALSRDREVAAAFVRGFHAAVSEIAWKTHRVEVAVRQGARGAVRHIRARAAVITVPVGVLRARPGARGAIVFRPDPPAIRAAVGRLAMGSVTKVVFAFDALPWSPAIRFLRTPEGATGVWWHAGSSRPSLAVAWTGGPAAAELDRQPAREIVAIALTDLARALGTSRARLEAGVRGAWLHDWQHDPFSRGAYSYPEVGGAHAGRALARPVENTLFFAGEATSSAWGTVEGALESGRRAARQVEASLRRALG